MGEFHPPFSEPPSFFLFFSQTPQPSFGSITLLQKFPPPPPPFQNPGSALAKAKKILIKVLMSHNLLQLIFPT